MSNPENFFNDNKDSNSTGNKGIDMDKIRAAADKIAPKIIPAKETANIKITGFHNDPENAELLDEYYKEKAVLKAEKKKKSEQKKRDQLELRLQTLIMKRISPK